METMGNARLARPETFGSADEESHLPLTCHSEKNILVADASSLSDSNCREILHALLANSQTCVLALDRQFNHVMVSAEFLSKMGMAGRNTIGMNHYALFPNLPAQWKRAHESALAGAVEQNSVGERYVSPDGAEVWVRWEVRPWRREDGSIAGIIILSEPLTAERHVQQVQAHLAAVVQSSNDAIISTCEAGLIVTWNASAERMFGLGLPEVIGRPIAQVFPPSLMRVPAKAAAVADDHAAPWETHWTTRDGRNLLLLISAAELRDAGGALNGYSYTVRDVTEQKSAEAKLSQQAEELARSNVELERFAYVTSHDLQEPLRTVRSFAQLLQKRFADRFTGEAAEYLRFISMGAERMSTLISDLLAYARVTTRGSAFVPVDSNQVVWQVVESLSTAIVESEAQIDVAPGLPVVHADPAQLGLVFQNLIDNAIKFRRGRTPIVSVGFTENETHFLFHVKDNGIGIASQYFDRIFIMFQRLHTVEEYGGTGIGLAVCKKIVERHQGAIWVESTPSVGSTFHFSIARQGGHHDREKTANPHD